jgi:hypothetical protein
VNAPTNALLLQTLVGFTFVCIFVFAFHFIQAKVQNALHRCFLFYWFYVWWCSWSIVGLQRDSPKFRPQIVRHLNVRLTEVSLHIMAPKWYPAGAGYASYLVHLVYNAPPRPCRPPYKPQGASARHLPPTFFRELSIATQRGFAAHVIKTLRRLKMRLLRLPNFPGLACLLWTSLLFNFMLLVRLSKYQGMPVCKRIRKGLVQLA